MPVLNADWKNMLQQTNRTESRMGSRMLVSQDVGLTVMNPTVPRIYLDNCFPTGGAACGRNEEPVSGCASFILECAIPQHFVSGTNLDRTQIGPGGVWAGYRSRRHCVGGRKKLTLVRTGGNTLWLKRGHAYDNVQAFDEGIAGNLERTPCPVIACRCHTCSLPYESYRESSRQT